MIATFVATVLFGSRAKGTSRAESDFDLIFFVADNPGYPEFSYQRLEFGGKKIDSNIIKAAALNQLCRSNSGWAYRLHRTRVVPEFTRNPELLAAGWMTKNRELHRERTCMQDSAASPYSGLPIAIEGSQAV